MTKYKIITVEDDTLCKTLYEDVLREMDCQHISLDNLKQLEKLLNEVKNIALILCDYNIGNDIATAYLEKIRIKHDMYQLPFVFVSGENNFNIMDNAYSIGANDFLVKPLILSELQQKIKIYCKLKELLDHE